MHSIRCKDNTAGKHSVVEDVLDTGMMGHFHGTMCCSYTEGAHCSVQQARLPSIHTVMQLHSQVKPQTYQLMQGQLGRCAHNTGKTMTRAQTPAGWGSKAVCRHSVQPTAEQTDSRQTARQHKTKRGQASCAVPITASKCPQQAHVNRLYTGARMQKPLSQRQ